MMPIATKLLTKAAAGMANANADVAGIFRRARPQEALGAFGRRHQATGDHV